VAASLGKVVRRLHPQQTVCPEAERLFKPDRHLGRDAGPAIEQAAHRLARDTELLGCGRNGEAMRLDDLSAQPDTGMNRKAGVKLDSHQ